MSLLLGTRRALLRRRASDPVRLALQAAALVYYRLDDDGTWADQVAGLDLSETNNPGTTAGAVGNAVSLSAASSQYLSRADHDRLSLGDRARTFVLICNVGDLSTNRTPLMKGSAAASDEYEITITAAGNFFWAIYDGAGGNTFDSQADGIGTGETHLLAAYHDPDANLIGTSIDGGAWRTKATTVAPNDAGGAFHIGAYRGSSNFMDGWIDEAGIYSGILTAGAGSQLAWIYDSGNFRGVF